jgi:hypothetical protein
LLLADATSIVALYVRAPIPQNCGISFKTAYYDTGNLCSENCATVLAYAEAQCGGTEFRIVWKTKRWIGPNEFGAWGGVPWINSTRNLITQNQKQTQRDEQIESAERALRIH